LTESLKQKAIAGTKWKTSLNIGRYLISFALSIILARLLEPWEFGLIGMVAILSAIAQIFIDSGLSQAVIRQKEIGDKDYDTVFYFNIVVSILFYILLFFTAPLVAAFYDEPILIPITRLITLVFLINSFGTIQNSILVREIKFKQQALCNFTGLGVSVIIASIMAFQGFGVYSIVAQAISQSLVTNTMFWITSDWRPKNSFSKKAFLKLWSFGSNILATNIIVRIVDNIDKVLIAKVFSATQLGYYVKARSSTDANQIVFTETLNATSFAVMVKGNKDKDELKRIHLLFYKLGTYGFFPIVFGFIAIAEAFIVVLFSDKWLPSVPIAQIYALTGIPYFLGALFMQTLMVEGKGRLYFRLTSGKKILTLLTLPVGIFWGFYPFVWSFVIINYVGLILDFILVGKILDNNIFTYLSLSLKPLAFSLVMVAIAWSITLLDLNYFITLPLQLLVGMGVYVFLSRIFKVYEYYYLRDIFFDQISKFKFLSKIAKKLL